MDRAIADHPATAPGHHPLQEAIANDVNTKRGTSYTVDNVAIQPGGKPVIKFLQTVMNRATVLCNPGPIPRQMSTSAEWAAPTDSSPASPGSPSTSTTCARKSQRPAIIYNDLHNPTGAGSTEAEREPVAQLALENDLVLSDEAYFGSVLRPQQVHRVPGRHGQCTVILYTASGSP